MAQDKVNIIIYTAIWAFLILVYLGVLRHFILNYFGKKTKCRVMLVDQFITQYKPIKKYPPYKTKIQYIVNFNCGKNTLKFEVSLWVYNTIKKNDKGILTYQGTRFISFEND